MSFDTLAPHYRWMEWLFAGNKLQRCRTAFLDRIRAPKNTLIFGEGNGRFLVEFCHQFPYSKITLVDISGGMLNQARHRLKRAGLDEQNITFIQADALEWIPPTQAFDLIVTCFFLDCFQKSELELLIPKISQAATPKAEWLGADYCIAESGFSRFRSKLIVSFLYAVFGQATHIKARSIVNPAPLLQKEGFKRHQREEIDFGMLYGEWWSRESTALHSPR